MVAVVHLVKLLFRVQLTREQAKKISVLAKLELTDTELDKYAIEIGNILDYVSQLQEIDVSDINETSNLNDFEGSVLRPDQPAAGLDDQHITLNATNGRAEGTNFKTSKIVGGE